VTLLQLLQLADKKSGFSGDEDEKWAAVNAAATYIYHWVCKENGGKFIVIDTSSIVLALNVEEYALPSDVQSLIRVRERENVASYWRVVHPADWNDANIVLAQYEDVVGFDDPTSQFSYIPPYLTKVDAATAAQILRMRFAPIPQEAHQVELVYEAKQLEMYAPESPNAMLPSGVHYAWLDFTIAELLDGVDDAQAEVYRAKGNMKLQMYLVNLRDVTKQDTPTQESYL
jgi:hypothetical protein